MLKFVLFPFDKIEKGKSILIYGAGDVGRCMLQQIQITSYCMIECFIDQNAAKIQKVEGIACILPDQIGPYKFDYILIAKLNNNSIIEIEKKLFKIGVDSNKIIKVSDTYSIDGYESEKIIRPDEVNWESYYLEAENGARSQYEEFLEPLINKYNLLKDQNLQVMDFACGHGRIANILRDKCNTIICCDINGEALQFCKNRFLNYENVKYVVSNMDGINAENEICDMIYSWDAMVHFSAELIEKYIKEFKRIVKQNGFVLIHHSNLKNIIKDNITEEWISNPSARSYISKEEFQYIAIKYGFTLIEQKTIDWAGIKDVDCITVLKKS